MRAFINRCLRFMAHLDSLSAVLGEKGEKMPNLTKSMGIYCIVCIKLSCLCLIKYTDCHNTPKERNLCAVVKKGLTYPWVEWKIIKLEITTTRTRTIRPKGGKVQSQCCKNGGRPAVPDQATHVYGHKWTK